MTARKAGMKLFIEGGADLNAMVNPRLVSLSLTEKREDDADELDLTLHNNDGGLEVPEPGVTLNLSLGWDSGDDVRLGLIEKGSFKVDEVGQSGPPDQITIRARSADMTGLLRQRRTKIWKGMTLGAILGEVARRHGRSARVGSGLSGLVVPAIEQEGKSDMAFVRDLGRRYDAVATWKNGMLLFLPIGASATASGTDLSSIILTKQKGWRWTFAQVDRENYDGAEAQWHDQSAGRRKTVKVGGNNRRKLKRVYSSEADARHAAMGATSRAKRKPYRFTYDLAYADTGLQPDMKVTLQGWGPKIDGITWLIENITTTFGSDGLHQRIEMESA